MDSDNLKDTERSSPSGSYEATDADLANGTESLVDVALPTLEADHEFDARYESLRLLGKGGMGYIQLFSDRHVGRKVAIKSMKSADRHPVTQASLVTRFNREARIQGQLEHPAVVPVYDLGVNPDGTPYFTMKRLHGLTLAEIVDRLAEGDSEIAEHFSQRKLLSEFVTICQAVVFAHEHGVIHRDIKPDNIMLGDYGEVYLLDWGLAKVAGDPEDGVTPQMTRAAKRAQLDVRDTGGRRVQRMMRRQATERLVAVPDSDVEGRLTQSGDVLGTVGYMAPEQVLGDIDTVDVTADVYALGATLFELLTLRALHPAPGQNSKVSSTLSGVPADPSQRTPERNIAPELCALCVEACQVIPRKRLATAAEFRDRLEAFLDGDRDQAQRQRLANRHAAEAETALPKAFDDESARAKALEEAGRALALNPDHERARGILLELMFTPPKEVPPAVIAEVKRVDERTGLWQTRASVFAHLAWLAMLPLLFWMGLKNPVPLIPLYVIVVIQVVATIAVVVTAKARSWQVTISILGNFIALLSIARLFGPHVLLPILAVASTLMFLQTALNRHPVLTVTLGCLAVIVPTVGEWRGVLDRTLEFVDGTMVVRSPTVALPEVATSATLLISSVVVILVAGMFTLKLRALLHEAQVKLYLQAWHLRQLLPEQARKGTPSTTPAASEHPTRGDSLSEPDSLTAKTSEATDRAEELPSPAGGDDTHRKTLPERVSRSEEPKPTSSSEQTTVVDRKPPTAS